MLIYVSEIFKDKSNQQKFENSLLELDVNFKRPHIRYIKSIALRPSFTCSGILSLLTSIYKSQRLVYLKFWHRVKEE